MKTKVLMAAVIAGLLVTAGAVSAQGRPGGGERPDFATLDANGDGMITVEELAAVHANRFANMDADGDGAVSLEELIAAANARASAQASQMLERMDENGDGLLQADEMQPPRGPSADRMLSHMDEDGDGMISEEEFDAKAQERGGRGGRGDRGDRGNHGHKGRG